MITTLISKIVPSLSVTSFASHIVFIRCKTNRGKTRQAEIRQKKAMQDETKQSEIRQKKARQDKARHHTTRPDKTWQEKARECKDI